MSKPRRSSGSWRQRQEKDPYVQRARMEGWRSRAVFKLEQIAAKERILRPDMTCIDLGAAPGSWSQYVSERLKGRVRIVALDILAMDPLAGVEFIQGDFTQDEIFSQLTSTLKDSRVDLVMSDMAPNISGTKAVDQPKSMYLAELAMECATQTLSPKGDFICKLFQGAGTDAYIAAARRSFGKVKALKPKASRASSSEIYLVATGFRPSQQ